MLAGIAMEFHGILDMEFHGILDSCKVLTKILWVYFYYFGLDKDTMMLYFWGIRLAERGHFHDFGLINYPTHIILNMKFA